MEGPIAEVNLSKVDLDWNGAIAFLDRDGVINKENGYILRYSQFFFLNGVKQAIKYIQDAKLELEDIVDALTM